MALASTRTATLAATLVAASTSAGAPAPGRPPRLALLPLVASTPGVAPSVLERVSELLGAELRGGARFEVLVPALDGGSQGPEPADAGPQRTASGPGAPPALAPPALTEAQALLAEARAAVSEATRLRARRELDPAIGQAEAAVTLFLGGASELTDVGELQDAQVLLAACLAQRGRDADATTGLVQALAVAPGRTPPLARTSPLFAAAVENARELLRRAPTGGARFVSSPPGATIAVDGLDVGHSPVHLRGLPPGRHPWRATLLTGERTGGVLEVSAGADLTVTVASERRDAVSRVLTALSADRLDEAALAAALDVARRVDAPLVFFGALGLEDGALVLESFVASPGGGPARRLPARRFDLELLSAGLELFALVGELSAKGDAAGSAMRLPEPVRALAAASPPRTAEVDFAALVAAAPGAAASPGAAATRGAAPGAGPRDGGTGGGSPPRRAPLRAR